MKEATNGTQLRQNVGLISVGNTVIVSVNSLWIMFMPFFFTDVGIDAITLGLVFTLFAASSAVTSPRSYSRTKTRTYE